MEFFRRRPKVNSPILFWKAEEPTMRILNPSVTKVAKRKKLSKVISNRDSVELKESLLVSNLKFLNRIKLTIESSRKASRIKRM